jgi:hypothetical protein
MRHDQIYKSARELFALEENLDNNKRRLNNKRDALVQTAKRVGKPIPEGIKTEHEKLEGHSPYAKWLMLMTEQPAVGFYFDETVRYDEEMAITGCDFLSAGFLQMPFDTVYFHAKKYFSESSGNAVPVCLWAKKVGENQIFLSAVREEDISAQPDFFQINIGQDIVGIARSYTEEGWPEVRKEYNSAEQQVHAFIMRSFCHMLMLLNHPVYDKELNEVSDAVNAKRERNGKARLSKYIYVNMRKQYKEALADGIGGYTVRPHWRRGHVRKLRDGRVIPVQPCLVNWDGEIEPDKKIYVYKSGDRKRDAVTTPPNPQTPN